MSHLRHRGGSGLYICLLKKSPHKSEYRIGLLLSDCLARKPCSAMCELSFACACLGLRWFWLLPKPPLLVQTKRPPRHSSSTTSQNTQLGVTYHDPALACQNAQLRCRCFCVLGNCSSASSSGGSRNVKNHGVEYLKTSSVFDFPQKSTQHSLFGGLHC